MSATNWIEADIPRLQHLDNRRATMLLADNFLEHNTEINNLPGAPFNEKYAQAIETIKSRWAAADGSNFIYALEQFVQDKFIDI